MKKFLEMPAISMMTRMMTSTVMMKMISKRMIIHKQKKKRDFT